MMKWIFLLKQETPLCSDPAFYDFVPYKHGPFSFTVYRDLDELTRFGYLNGDGLCLQADLLSAARENFRSLSEDLRKAVLAVLARYSRLPQDRLVLSIYEKYPWFASRSELNGKAKTTVGQSPAAYTAGYEGESIETFLQKLLKAGIGRIVDVRNNPVSRKYGFSKGALNRLSTNLDIEYVHLPALGVPPSHRRSLETFEDYQELMLYYEHSILPTVPEARQQAAQMLKDRPSVLVCFEADSRCCHRGRLATALSADTGLEVIHL